MHAQEQARSKSGSLALVRRWGASFVALAAAFAVAPVFTGCSATNESEDGDEPSAGAASDAVVNAARPFPQASRPFGTRPSNHGQATLNSDVASAYERWRDAYVEASSGVTPGGGYVVRMTGVGDGADSSKTTSEAHGYGMIIFALMAVHDPKAKKYFDGMFNMFDHHRSTANHANMSWIIAKNEKASGDSDSATDGDMDIAYALILADRQWGSGGAINYLQQAKNTITKGIKKGDMGPHLRTGLGDWDDDPWNTRASDWMPDHMRAFQAVTGDGYWADATSTVYSLIGAIQKDYSPKTGLVPDFVIGKTPKPAPNNYLDEGTVDFSWNACRFPWRISVDHGLYGAEEPKKALVKVMDWLVDKTGNKPSKIKAGYRLNGDAQESYSDLAFSAPMVAAATIDGKYQTFLNKGWDMIKDEQQDYYGDTIALLSMLHASGNWWRP